MGGCDLPCRAAFKALLAPLGYEPKPGPIQERIGFP